MHAMSRTELATFIEAASVGITASTRTKLLAMTATTDAVAVGWWHCDGVNCPARQVGRNNQAFQESFDRAMAARFGHEITDPFVVRISD